MPSPRDSSRAHDTAALFARGLELYRAGALEPSQRHLETVLAREPSHFDALHLAGLVAARLQRYERAVALIRRALDVNPSVAPAHRHLGNALRDLGRLEEALTSYSRALELRRGFKEAHVNRAQVLLRLGRSAEALSDLDQSLALGADDAEVHTYRASALLALGRGEEAAASCETALRRQPDCVDAHVNRAAALYLRGAYAEALASCDRALALRPDHADAHAHRGAALLALWRLEEALASLERGLALQPHSAFAHNLRALCLLGRQSPVEALASAERAIELRPDSADAHNTRGLALTDAKCFDEALASFDRALALDATLEEPRFNQGVVHLIQGDFERGWALYDRRPVRKPLYLASAQRWDGREEIRGRTVFTYAEQGLGDTIQFCRYAKLLSEQGARVVLAVQESLCTLLRSLDPRIEVIGAADPVPAHDVHCPLLSLPRAFGTTVERIPAAIPYLAADPERVAYWSRRLVGGERLIGIRWQGSTGRADAGRSFALSNFEPIAGLPHVRLVSLQKGAGAEQLERAPCRGRVLDLGPDFEPGGRDAFLDVAAVMQCLDLVITSDTSIAHLAGALGRPTWLALKCVPDFRWMLERADSPWYPTMRLFRQPRPGDWANVFSRMRAELSRGG